MWLLDMRIKKLRLVAKLKGGGKVGEISYVNGFTHKDNNWPERPDEMGKEWGVDLIRLRGWEIN